MPEPAEDAGAGPQNENVTPEGDNEDGIVTPPDSSDWWKFESKDQAEDWANNLITKRLQRHKKTTVDPIAQERDTLKAEVERLKPFEDATKSADELKDQKLAGFEAELNELRQYKAQTEHANLVRKIADEVGLPAAFIPRVRGNSEDEIREDATDLLNALSEGGSNTKKVPPTKTPKDSGNGGSKNATPGGGGSDESDDDLIKEILGQVSKDRTNGGLTTRR